VKRFELLRGMLLVAACLLAPRPAFAHSFEPAVLDLRERGAGVFDLVWRPPAAGSGAMLPGSPELAPELPGHCLPVGDPPTAAGHAVSAGLRLTPADGDETLRLRIDCGARGLRGERVVITGLDRSRVDAFVRIAWRSGEVTTAVLRSDLPEMVAPVEHASVSGGDAPAGGVVLAYARLGVEHILFGFDHLAFVLGLVLLVPSLRVLVETITAFTLAHSLSLALAVLGLVNLPQAPVEALIALSIVLVASELARPSDPPGLARRYPWLVAFAFGLLHGLGFAGALTAIGLPGDQLPLALVSFNLGVEAGQLAFVALVLVVRSASRHALQRVAPRPALSGHRFSLRAALALTPAYAIGALATAWTIERIARFWTLTS